ncbi:MAG: glycosyltransferase [Polyangiaceae bacterium]|jgi:vancomycin aglycone glucosyltransferase
MRVLLSAVGTRGDAQPVVAVALALRERGHEPRLCVPPNFVEWATDLGLTATPVGVEMRSRAGATPSAPPTPEQVRALVSGLVTDQFRSVGGAAEGCDVILGAGEHQVAARSVAEARGIRYVSAVYCPIALPSPDYAPASVPAAAGCRDTAKLSEQYARSWNERYLASVNANRDALGLEPLSDVRSHILTERPWLAADATLGPHLNTPGLDVTQTGAWLLADEGPLDAAVESFLDAGDPPVYLGFGSMPSVVGAGRTLAAAARAVARRAIVSRGWGDFEVDNDADVLVVDDVSHHALFPRVAAVVHHGGAGTTTTAARHGVPQVSVPMFHDQPYWASRIEALGIGASVPVARLTPETLAAALAIALSPAAENQAKLVSREITLDGASVAAELLVTTSYVRTSRQAT